MNYPAHVTEDRRLVLLRVLQQSSGFTSNEFLLQTMCETFGHMSSIDQVRTDLAWLAEQGLLVVEAVADVRVARLLGRGEDVALGRATVPGIKRPRAG